MKKQRETLRIAMFGHKRIPSREGGVEIVVDELATRMVQKGHTVVCYNRGGHHVSGKEYDTKKVKEYKGVRIKRVPAPNFKGIAAAVAGLFASIRAAFGRYDVVHFHAEGSCAFLWLVKLFGKRCIVTVHGLDWQREKWKQGFASKYIKLGEKMAVKYADEIIVLSRGVQNYFKETYGRDTQFIPNGVERPVIREADYITQKYGLTRGNYILYLGRIVPEKGLRYLVEAFGRVNTDKYLVIAGGSSDTEDFLQEIRAMSAADDRVLFTGFVSGEPLEELYSNAYIYTLPSDLEGMPLSLLEAMSYGNCCLVSDIAECAEVVEDKAATSPRGAVDALVDNLQALCDNPDLVEAYQKEAADFICEKYNWDAVVDETLQLYRKKQS